MCCLAGKTLECVRKNRQLSEAFDGETPTRGSLEVGERASQPGSVLLFQQSLLEGVPYQGGTARQAELGHQP